MTVLTWTDDRVEQLKKLWEAGLSASQIAAELGNVTRNAVIGKVHRLGLSGRAKSPSSAAPRQRKARPVQHMMRVSRPQSRGNTARSKIDQEALHFDPVEGRGFAPHGFLTNLRRSVYPASVQSRAPTQPERARREHEGVMARLSRFFGSTR